MTKPHILIVGGGLAGLSTGCYALANGWRTTVFEHNLALGGVCTAWQRGPYTMDGCIHWLTGGPFDRIYEELHIIPPVELHPLEHFATYRHARQGWEVSFGRDLQALRHELRSIAPEDGEEIDRIIHGAEEIADLSPPLDRPPELATLRSQLEQLWQMRHQVGTFVHFRKPIGEWGRTHLRSPALRALFSQMLMPEVPSLFLLMLLGYLGRGYLSRPYGGTRAFRDAIIGRYRELGGEAHTSTTVEEILVRDDRARGVRLTDGTLVEGDLVVSTASAPETVLRLLGGRYGAETVRERLERWTLFPPIVLAGYGVELPLRDVPPTLIIAGIDPFEVGRTHNDHLYARIFNDDPAFAPPGHTVVQLLLQTDYEWWATRGSDYEAAKDEVAELGKRLLNVHLPGFATAVRTVDIATPLTFWHNARSWRGAYEGWIPTGEAFFGHVAKTLPGLDDFYMAGQWVEPGGGVPTALMSGRHLVQILCDRADRPFAGAP